MISSEALTEFKQIVLEDYGLELTDEQALADATALLEVIRILVSDFNNSSLISKDPIEFEDMEVLNVTQPTC